MHFSERHNSMPPLRNPAEHDDFQKRPWWDWGYPVLFPVYDAMLEQGLDKGPERFQHCLALLIGGFAMPAAGSGGSAPTSSACSGRCTRAYAPGAVPVP